MRHLKKFNESKSEDFDDYLYTLFETYPDEVIEGDEWYFGRWYSNENLNSLSDKVDKSKKFLGYIVVKEVNYDISFIDILVVTHEYYSKNYKWKVDNLNWEKHPMAVEFDKNPELQRITSKIISDKAGVVKNLPNRCSLIRGLRFGDGLEFWPQKYIGEPIYVESNTELQALIYKYICDDTETTNESLFKSNDDYYENKTSLWKVLTLSGINVKLQPGVKIDKGILDVAITKINKIGKEWYLVLNSCEVYNKKNIDRYKTRFLGLKFKKESNSTFIKFRISDCEGDNEYGTLGGRIPRDIKSEISSDCYKQFGQHGVFIDEFEDRGYLLIDVCIKV